MKERRVMIAIALPIAAMIVLAACSTPGDPMPTPSELSSSASPSPSASPTPEPEPVEREPQLLPGGSALANKEYFDFVSKRLFKAKSGATSDDIISMLIKAGFAKKALQVTKDTTPTGRKAEAIEYSVRAHDECLIGQWGKNRYTSTIAPVLVDGSCLIGKTKPLD